MISEVLGTVAIVPKGEYNPETYYEYLNVVTYQGSSYAAKGPVHDILPTDTTYWQLLAQKADFSVISFEIVNSDLIVHQTDNSNFEFILNENGELEVVD